MLSVCWRGGGGGEQVSQAFQMHLPLFLQYKSKGWNWFQPNSLEVWIQMPKGSLRLLPKASGCSATHSVQKEDREEGPNAPSLPGPMTELDPMGQRDHRAAAGGAGGATQGLR